MLLVFGLIADTFAEPWANISNKSYKDIRRSANGGVFGDDSGDPGAAITIDNCAFVNCSVSKSRKDSYAGGAIYVEFPDVSFFITSTHFVNCSCDHVNFGGGAIFFFGNLLQCVNCIFESDSASHSGGAIFSWSQRVIVNSSRADNCTCKSSGGFILSITTKEIILNGCNINNCGGQTDGAISGLETGLTCIGCTFTNCQAQKSAGAIELASSSVAKLEGCRFVGNKGGNAGAILLNNTRGARAFIDECVFEDNSGKYASFLLDSVPEIRISDCTLTFKAAPGTSNIALLERKSGDSTIFFSGNAFHVISNADEMDGYHLYCTAQAKWSFSQVSVFDVDKNKSLYFLHGEPTGFSDFCEFSFGGNKKPLSAGAIAGIVVAVLAVVIGVAAVVWFFVIRPRRSKTGFTRTTDGYII